MLKTTKTELLPIVLTVSLVMTLMYLFNPDQIYLLGLIAFVFCAFLFSFFNYIRTLKKIAPVIYSATLFMMLYFTFQTVKSGMYSENVSIFEFIYLPYDVGVRSTLYSLLLFMVSCYFFSSFIYYFTSVIYRQSVVFMIILIPCVVYAKKLEPLPFPLLVFMAALYICVMIHCKQRMLMKKIKVVMDGSYKKSLGLFILITLITATIIPKPELTPYRGVIDNLSNINLIPSERIGLFTDFSMGTTYNSYLSDRILFYVRSDEPLYLKKQAFDIYGDKGIWEVMTNNNFDYGHKIWEAEEKANDPGKFLLSVGDAVTVDSAFAEQYGLDSKYAYTLPSSEKTAMLIGYDFLTAAYLNPIGTFGLSVSDTYKTQNGEIFLTGNISLKQGDSFSLNYYSQLLNKNKLDEFSRNFLNDNYGDFLYDLKSVLKNNDLSDEEYYDTVKYKIEEYENAQSYLENSYAFYSSKLRSLAIDLTRDCESDLEKAIAIENYFWTNGFKYSLNYKPPSGSEGAEYFVFTSKKGACSDFASAMVIMAREAGLPARYVEGFVVREQTDDGRYVVRELHSHAYPEIYISGKGWTVFEPTVNSDEQQRTSDKGGFSLSTKTITAALLILLGIVIILIIIFSKTIKEAAFRISLRFRGKRKLSALFTRLRMIVAHKYGLSPDTLSIGDTERIIRESYNIDVSDFSDSFERMCYKDGFLSARGFSRYYSLYKAVYKSAKKNGG